MSLLTFGPVDDNVHLQMQNCLAVEDESIGVLCADSHLGYAAPIGSVIAYRNLISPSNVGYDIGCGNLAVRTNINADDLDIKRVMDEVWATVSFGVGRNNATKVDHPIIDRIAHSPIKAQRDLYQSAQNQLGTVGSGNHYVDLFKDIFNNVWIGVHFGSRGFGHKTCTWAMEEANYNDNDMMSAPCVIDIHTPLGSDYIEAMDIALAYAYANRETVVNQVLGILGATTNFSVHNHHNAAWLEQHNRENVWVHRKGATPALPGQYGFVGSSMGEPSVILRGLESDLSRQALYSTVHGAGRAISRKKAAGKTKRVKTYRCKTEGCRNDMVYPSSPTHCRWCQKDTMYKFTETVQVSPGLVNYGEWLTKLSKEGIEIRGGGADEAPECYKRLNDVLKYHEGTVEIVHTLFPIGIVMASKDIEDPFRD